MNSALVGTITVATMFGLAQSDLTGRFSTQVGLPGGNSNGVRPPIPSSGAAFGGSKGSFNSRDDGMNYMGWNTQETVAKEYKLIFDINACARLGTGPEKLSRGQMLFTARETQYERRPQYAWFGYTLSTLNRILSSGPMENDYYRLTEPQARRDAPLELNWANVLTVQEIVSRFNFHGIMDVVKPVGSTDSKLVREGVSQIMVNCIIGGRVPQCFNYWAVRPPGHSNNSVAIMGVREHLYMWLLLHPKFEWIAEDPAHNPNGPGRYRYFWQYAPVCTFLKQEPTYDTVFPANPNFAALTGFSTAIPVGRSSFIDDRTPKKGADVTALTYPHLAGNNVDAKLAANMPQLTLHVDHMSGH